MELALLPREVTVSVALLLSPRDLSALGSCSKYLWEICTCDEIWREFYSRRWPEDQLPLPWPQMEASAKGYLSKTADNASQTLPGSTTGRQAASQVELARSVRGAGKSASMAPEIGNAEQMSEVRILSTESTGSASETIACLQDPEGSLPDQQEIAPEPERLRPRAAYVARVRHVEAQAAMLVELLRQCSCNDSVEVAAYQRAMAALVDHKLGFADVAETLLQRKHSVLVNLLGLHYAALHLGREGPALVAVLNQQRIAGRQLCLRWWSMGSMARGGYRLRDEMHMVNAGLLQLTESGRCPLLAILQRGTLYETLRVQISADFTSSAWVARDMHWQR